MNSLETARNAINEIDKKMAELFKQRMLAVRDIAAYKKERGIAIFDAEREKTVIARNVGIYQDNETRMFYSSFLQDVMNVSKRYQRRLMEGMRVAYSGVEGAFADIAAKRIFPDALHIGYPDFSAAYQSVENGDCECAVLPIENSYAGAVGQVMDLMFEGDLFVNGVYTLPVVQNLLGLPGVNIKEIKTIISHPQALAQCSEYIKSHGWTTVSATNTAIAAQEVAQRRDKTVAAIASFETAALYGLEVLDHDINESNANSTKFAVFSRVEQHPDTGNSKFLLLFTVNDVAGALAKAINVISAYGFNMKVLRSRPVRSRDWQYYFYVEAEGDETTEDGRKMLSELAEQCETMKIAGHYTAEISLRKNQG